jgi:hypothetical protein
LEPTNHTGWLTQKSRARTFTCTCIAPARKFVCSRNPLQPTYFLLERPLTATVRSAGGSPAFLRAGGFFGGSPRLETLPDLNRVNSFLNLRVADIWACYKQWRAKGAVFLTEPLDNHGWEWRCYMRDPDGYLIEVGQYTQMALDHFKNHAT